MPIYEYVCQNCGKKTEKLVSISSAETEIDCPECGHKAEKIMSSTSFQLKGGGWYAQGYSDKPSCSAKSDSPKCKSCPASKS